MAAFDVVLDTFAAVAADMPELSQLGSWISKNMPAGRVLQSIALDILEIHGILLKVLTRPSTSRARAGSLAFLPTFGCSSHRSLLMMAHRMETVLCCCLGILPCANFEDPGESQASRWPTIQRANEELSGGRPKDLRDNPRHSTRVTRRQNQEGPRTYDPTPTSCP